MSTAIHYHINVFYSEEDGGYIAFIPEPEGPQDLDAVPDAFSDDEREDEDPQDHALDAVHRDPDPGAPKPLRRVRDGEHV